jgi:PmbA protein
MLDELQSRAERAVAIAKAKGADGAFAWSQRSRQVSVNYRDGALEKVEESTSSNLSIEIYAGGRYSSHSTTDPRQERLEMFIKEAVALTRALEEDPDRAMPDPALFEGRADIAKLDLLDPSLEGLTPEQREEWCAAINEHMAASSDLISATSGAYNVHRVSAGASSNGFSGAVESTDVWMGGSVVLKDTGDKRVRGGVWVGGRYLEQASMTPEEIAAMSLERAQRERGAVKGPTQRSIMVVDPRAAGQVIGYLLRPADARSIQQGRSFWAGEQGEQVASELLTIVDDPLLPRGSDSRPFDSEGIAAKPLTLIEGGVLKNLYVDTYYGRKAGMTPTTGSSSNRVVAGGDKDLAALLAEAGSGVYITGWLGGNADNNTGDFSVGCRGHLIENGQVGAAVTEMNITGNLLDLFGNLVAVGSDPWPWSGTQVGTLVFEAVQFSGA